MGGCLARPAGTRRVDVVRPARSEDARGKEDRPSHRVSDRLPLSPLDSALCIRGLVVYWAFGFDRRLDPDAVRASLAATLVKYPALAGRARVRARRGATLSLEVDLDHPNAGVAFEVRDEPATTLEDLRRAGPPSAQNNVTPSSLFRPLHIRCCENEGALCAVRLTRLGGAAAPATVLGVSWSHALADGRAMRAFCEAWTSEALARAAAAPRAPPPRAARSATRATTASRCWRARSRATRAFPELRLEEPPSAFALARGACGVLGDVAFRRLAQVTVHIPAADARALKASLDATSTNDALLAATWTLFRRLREADRAVRRCKGSSEARQTARALFPVDHRRDDGRGLPSNLFGNASLMACARLEEETPGADRGARDRDPGRAEEAPEKAAARRMRARDARRRVRRQVAGGLGASARRDLRARARLHRDADRRRGRGRGGRRVFPQRVAVSRNLGLRLRRRRRAPAPRVLLRLRLPGGGVDGGGVARAGGGLDVSMNVPRRLAARTPREMQEVVRALSDGNVPARGAG